MSRTLLLLRKLKAQRPDSYMLPCSTLTLDMGFFFGDTHQPTIVSFSCRRKLRCTWLSMVNLETTVDLFLSSCKYLLFSISMFLKVWFTSKLTWTSFAPKTNLNFFCTRGEVHGCALYRGALNQVRCKLRKTQVCFQIEARKVLKACLLTWRSWGTMCSVKALRWINSNPLCSQKEVYEIGNLIFHLQVVNINFKFNIVLTL